MVKIEDLLQTKKPQDLNKFTDYLLNKLKRDNSAITLNDGYIMAGHQGFIINDCFYKRSEAKTYLIKWCESLL